VAQVGVRFWDWVALTISHYDVWHTDSVFLNCWQNFKRNLSKVNGGSDFDEDMLDEVYIAIKYVAFDCFVLLFLFFCNFQLVYRLSILPTYTSALQCYNQL